VELIQTNGAEFARAVAGAPELIVLGVNLPDPESREVLGMIESMNPLVPVIIITTSLQELQVINESRIDVILEKPLDLVALLAVIRKLLNEPDHHRTLRMGSQRVVTT
jgi:DNA-binding response OmpR family regulator